jgi:hypothetical protein
MAPAGRRVLAASLAALLIAALLVLVGAPETPAAPDTFVEMDDGVKLAVGIQFPRDFDPQKKYPAIFEMSGYDGASAQGGTLIKEYIGPHYEGAPLQDDSRQVTERWEDRYVTVHVSVRGTGCSGGEFDIFNQRTAQDGKFIIDNWIPAQSWSNGDVAIVGHSYGGITGFMVAATQPTHLRAVSVSGLIDDLYRGLTYPGGVSNYGFPVLWTGAIRPFYDLGGGVLPGIMRNPDSDDDPDRQQKCAAEVANKRRTITDEPFLQGTSGFDNQWFITRSLMTYADRITAPLHITGAYQDEQTGPRGPAHLWQAATNEDLPYRRLLLTNGDHGTQNPGSTGPLVWRDRKAFIDHYLLKGKDAPALPAKPVRVLWELHGSGEDRVANGITDAQSWPLPDTTFTDWFVQPDQTLSTAPSSGQGSWPYVTGSPRQSWSYQAGHEQGSPFTTADGPDQLEFSTAPLPSAVAVHGPVTASLQLSSTAIDTDLFVELVDDAPNGDRTYLQRGLLKASHRAINVDRSDKWPDGHIYRPYRPHTSQQFLTPGAVYDYLVEIFPVGHVFRADHRITMIVHAPPLVDSYYAYAPQRAPAGVNTVFGAARYPDGLHFSKLTLPVVSMPAGLLSTPELGCNEQEAVRCVSAS